MRHRSLTCWGMAAIIGFVSTAFAAQGTAAPKPTRTEEALAAEVNFLERQFELARSDEFYLLLDPAQADLMLMLGGAVLDRWVGLGLEIGRPRTVLGQLGQVGDWRTVTWANGALTPPRPIEEQEVRLPDPGGEEAPPAVIPPTAEEAIPVPTRFWIRFEGGLALEVRQDLDPGTTGWWDRRRVAWMHGWQDLISVLGGPDRDALRLRLTLPPEAAATLYRALPPRPSLIIATPDATVPLAHQRK